MLNFFKIEWQTKKLKKVEKKIKTEDYSIFNNKKEYAIIADGVSRDKYSKKGFSLAYEVAKKSSKSLSLVLSKENKNYIEKIKEGFKKANEIARKLNEEERLWGKGNNDYLDRDLAGTCLACIIKKEDQFFYGFIGDCRIFKISSSKKVFITKDIVKEASLEFPKIKDKEKRKLIIRKERRNNPKSSYKTYGVITGEQDALNKKYFKTGKINYKKGDIIGIFSDGFTPFFEEDKDFIDIISTFNRNKINEYLKKEDLSFQNNDEKTLIFCKL